jgi:calcineurin-like phosphoesterase family protein
MDFFTSDLHLGHKATLKPDFASEFRSYPDMESHDSGIIDKINSVATAYTDTLYIIGDVSFHKTPAITAELLSRIIARKVLVKGNHDHRTKNKMGAVLPGPVMVELDEFHHYLEREFDVFRPVVVDEVYGTFGSWDEQNIVMFHFPMMHWRNQDKGWWHLHGHLHGAPAGVPGKIMDVGWDKWGKPLSLDDVSAYMADKPLRANHHTGVATC